MGGTSHLATISPLAPILVLVCALQRAAVRECDCSLAIVVAMDDRRAFGLRLFNLAAQALIVEERAWSKKAALRSSRSLRNGLLFRRVRHHVEHGLQAISSWKVTLLAIELHSDVAAHAAEFVGHELQHLRWLHISGQARCFEMPHSVP